MRSKRVFLLGHCRNCNANNCATEFCTDCSTRRACPRCNRRLRNSSFFPDEGGLCHACWLKSQRPKHRSFRRGTLEQTDVPINNGATDIDMVVHSNSATIQNIIENAVAQHHAVKFFVTCDIEFFGILSLAIVKRPKLVFERRRLLTHIIIQVTLLTI